MRQKRGPMATLMGVIGIAGGIYLVLLLLLYTLQSRLIHQPGTPGRALVATPEDLGVAYETVNLTTADGVRLHGWYTAAPQEPARTLLFFHGNAGNISHRLESLRIFHELGLRTLIIDYRGYGRSEGAPSEAGLYRDAEAAWRYLVEQKRIPPEEVIIFGRSLGAAVAAYLATQQPSGGLILESAFTSVPDLAADLHPVFPVRALARVHYPTLKWVKQVGEPVLVIHSEGDDIIPFEHGRAVYAAAREPKRFLKLQGDHNTGFLQSRASYQAALTDWLSQLP